jgi:hypothetical protein
MSFTEDTESLAPHPICICSPVRTLKGDPGEALAALYQISEVRSPIAQSSPLLTAKATRLSVPDSAVATSAGSQDSPLFKALKKIFAVSGWLTIKYPSM